MLLANIFDGGYKHYVHLCTNKSSYLGAHVEKKAPQNGLFCSSGHLNQKTHQTKRKTRQSWPFLNGNVLRLLQPLSQQSAYVCNHGAVGTLSGNIVCNMHWIINVQFRFAQTHTKRKLPPNENMCATNKQPFVHKAERKATERQRAQNSHVRPNERKIDNNFSRMNTI